MFVKLLINVSTSAKAGQNNVGLNSLSKSFKILQCVSFIFVFNAQAQQASEEGIKGKQLLLLHTYLGIAWTLGCIIFGCVVVNNSTECRISKQYLCQAALFMSGLSILAFTAVKGYNGYVVFVWIFGICSGGYHYALKMYIYEKVRARNFARAWGFAQFSMSLPNMFGVPISGKYIIQIL